MNKTPQSSCYSAAVRMELRLGDQIVQLSHMGPGYFITRDAVTVEPTEAELAFSVDGRERVGKVYLPAGIHPQRKQTTYVAGQAATLAAA